MDLLPFQKEAVTRMVQFLEERGCVYNASDMGTGKTAVTLNALKGPVDILIICPSVVKYVWAEEIKKWCPRYYVQIINSSKDSIPFIDRSAYLAFTVISYDLASRRVKDYEISGRNWDYLILDEAHYLKSHTAKRTKAILTHIWPKAKYKICLSGTPFTQSIMDCWTTFSRMSPEDFGDYWKFAYSYCKVAETPWGKKFYGVKNHEKLRDIINKKFFLRYKKEDVLKELPPKVWQKIPLGPEYLVKMTKEETQANEKYLELLKESYVKGTVIRAVPPKAVATMRREQGIKKVPAVIEFCQSLLDQDKPIVVFAYHLDVIKKLWEGLKEYAPVVITGETGAKERQEAVDSFQRGAVQLFIGQINASGVGITLTRSSTLIFAELDWSPATVNQASDRLHRIGATGNVTIYYLSVIGSIDEKISDVVIEKSKTFNKVIG